MTPNNTTQPPSANPLGRPAVAAPAKPVAPVVQGATTPLQVSNTATNNMGMGGVLDNTGVGNANLYGTPATTGTNNPLASTKPPVSSSAPGGNQASQAIAVTSGAGMVPGGAVGPAPNSYTPTSDASASYAAWIAAGKPATDAQGRPLDVRGQPITYGFDNTMPNVGQPSAGQPNVPGASGTPTMAPQMDTGSNFLPPGTVGGTTISGNQPGTSVNIPGTGGSLPGGIQNTVNTSNVPSLVGGDALSQQMQTAQQAAYAQAQQVLDPQWANQENQLRNNLVNQGIPQNSEAWNRAMDDFQRQKSFAYQQAQEASVQQGNAAQAQLFGQGLSANQNQFGQNLSGGQFTNAAQSQAAQQILQQMGYGTQLGIAGIGAQTSANQLSEQIAQNNFNNSETARNQDINELLLQQQNPLQLFQALTQGTGVSQPNFTSTPGSNIGGTDIASIIAQALQQGNNVYNTQVGQQNSNTSAAASIIAALLSDRRFKKNIRMIGMHEVGVPLYAFDYVWGQPAIGVMADEVEKVMPHAVIDVGGMKAVNYAAFSKVA